MTVSEPAHSIGSCRPHWRFSSAKGLTVRSLRHILPVGQFPTTDVAAARRGGYMTSIYEWADDVDPGAEGAYAGVLQARLDSGVWSRCESCDVGPRVLPPKPARPTKHAATANGRNR